MLMNPTKAIMQIAKWVTDLDWRLLLLIIPPLSILVFISLSSIPFNSFSSFAPLKSFISNHTLTTTTATATATTTNSTDFVASSPTRPDSDGETQWKDELLRSRIAVCLVGGARRFELTGPSIIENILKAYPNADLFLHSPLDTNAYKFSLLKAAPRLASVRIFEPRILNATESQVRVLTAANSPNGIQGLLQYFSLVEGCLNMIEAYQKRKQITYKWIVRTRVDGYWNAPLDPNSFVPGKYLIPPGSSFGGLNDRLGIGDLNTSIVALSRLSLIPQLDSAGFSQLNSETAFKAQLTTQHVPYLTKRLPFCIVTDRKYAFPPSRFGVPVAAMSSKGPLSGAKCRPCTAVCKGQCVADVMNSLYKGWSWTNWQNGTLELCDAHGDWERDWEENFNRIAGKKLASEIKKVRALNVKKCVDDFSKMKNRAFSWEAPPPEHICRLGLVRLLGINGMWKAMLQCHRCQYKIIVEAKSLDSIASNAKLENDHLEVAIKLMFEVLSWNLNFSNWIKDQKGYIKALNGWLLKCLAYEPEETTDGRAPFSPGRIGAPAVFVIAHQWSQAIDMLPEKEVIEALQSLFTTVNQLLEQHHMELQKMAMANKDMDRIVKLLEREQQKMRKIMQAQEKNMRSLARESKIAITGSLHTGIKLSFMAFEIFAVKSKQAYDELCL